MKRVTDTHRVLQLLTMADDFMTLRDVMRRTGLSANRASCTLIYLRERKAVACFEQDGTLWWFAQPQEDDRSRRVELREIEPPGSRKPRRLRAPQLGIVQGGAR